MFSQTFKAFQYRDFRIMWIGACLSSIGTWMQQLAQSWLVYSLSGSPFYLGLDAFLGQVPIILFSLLGGVFADRANRRTLLIVSQLVQLSCAFLLAALFFFKVVKVWHILCLSFMVGMAQAFGGPAYSALIPTLVGAEELSNAIALNSIQFNLARVIGPMLGGIALRTLGATWCFGLNGVSYIAVIISLLMIRPKFKPVKTSESVVASMKQGISFIRRQEGMEPLIALALCMTIFGFPLIVFLPVFAKEVFKGDSSLYTVLLCFSGAGSVVGALIVASIAKRSKQGKTALILLIVLGILIAGFSLSKVVVLSTALIFLSGGALIGVFAMITSLVQAITPDGMRGRVMSVYNMAFRGGMPIGSLVAGSLIPIFSAPIVIACNGLMLVLLGCYFLFSHRRIAAL